MNATEFMRHFIDIEVEYARQRGKVEAERVEKLRGLYRSCEVVEAAPPLKAPAPHPKPAEGPLLEPEFPPHDFEPPEDFEDIAPDFEPHNPQAARQPRAQGSGVEFPRDPLAKSMNDLVTPKQLGMIRALAREAQVDADAECKAVMRVTTDELSKKAASCLIDHLKSLSPSTARKTA